MNAGSYSGYIANDIELKQTPNGVSVCRFRVAVRRPNKKDTTDFIDFVAWRQKAEFVSRYFRKGQWIEISGCLTTYKWEDKATGKPRYGYEVECTEVSFGGGKREDGAGAAENAFPAFSEDAPTFEEVSSDEALPF